jgi:hypothetical protein
MYSAFACTTTSSSASELKGAEMNFFDPAMIIDNPCGLGKMVL